jgi:8-oxo-dGTP pyrophosphatase MutT (NUDIX family)
MGEHQVVPFDRVELRYVPQEWPFAEANRAAIEAHFAARQRTNPALWNGQVLLACEHHVAGGMCRGAFLETDFASFNAWRDWGRPAAAVADCFGAVALRSADDAYLLGVMAAHTASAGQVYFPCGMPDLDDVVDGYVDLDRSARRELEEETGLSLDDMHTEPGWLAVVVGAVIMHTTFLRAPQPAEELRRRILRHLASQNQPELSDIRIVRGPDDLDPMMPDFVTAFLRHMWR